MHNGATHNDGGVGGMSLENYHPKPMSRDAGTGRPSEGLVGVQPPAECNRFPGHNSRGGDSQLSAPRTYMASDPSNYIHAPVLCKNRALLGAGFRPAGIHNFTPGTEAKQNMRRIERVKRWEERKNRRRLMPSRAFQDPAAIADRSTKVIYDKFSQEERRDAARRIITQRDGKDPHRRKNSWRYRDRLRARYTNYPMQWDNPNPKRPLARPVELTYRPIAPIKSTYHFTPQYEDPAIKVSPRVQQTEYKDYDSRVQAARAAIQLTSAIKSNDLRQPASLDNGTAGNIDNAASAQKQLHQASNSVWKPDSLRRKLPALGPRELIGKVPLVVPGQLQDNCPIPKPQIEVAKSVPSGPIRNQLLCRPAPPRFERKVTPFGSSMAHGRFDRVGLWGRGTVIR